MRAPAASLRARVLEPLLDLYHGRATRDWLPAVERRLALSAREAAAADARAVRALLVHAYRTVPFYRRRMDACGFDPREARLPADLACLPPLERDDIAGDPDALLSRAWRGRPLVEATSGGTTSTPVPFLQPQDALWRKNAAAVALRRRLGWQPGDRVAVLWGAAGDLPPPPRGRWGRAKARVRQLLEPTLWLPSSDLAPAPLAAHAEALRAHRPAVLQAYPSAADALARQVLAEGRACPIPRVVLTAETVFPAQRARIAEAFGAHVHSFYGAREVGWIASECPEHAALHLNTDGIHLETDADGRLLVTDLVNRAMPLIRYAVGDRGRLADRPCPCGDPRPVLAELHGRVTDMFPLPSGKRVPGVLCDIRNYQLVDGVVETQLIQHDLHSLEVRWVAAANFRPEHLDALRRFLDGCFDGELAYRFVRVPRIEPEPNGKVRTCRSYVDPGSGRATRREVHA